MSVIKPRTRGKRLVKSATRLDQQIRRPVRVRGVSLGESTEYVLNQLIASSWPETRSLSRGELSIRSRVCRVRWAGAARRRIRQPRATAQRLESTGRLSSRDEVATTGRGRGTCLKDVGRSTARGMIVAAAWHVGALGLPLR